MLQEIAEDTPEVLIHSRKCNFFVTVIMQRFLAERASKTGKGYPMRAHPRGSCPRGSHWQSVRIELDSRE